MTETRSELGAWLETADGRHWAVPRTCSIGRSRTNQIVLADMRVSRRHALIQMQAPGEYWVVDFGTVNGTRVDGRRIAMPTLLRDGAVLEIAGGSYVFRQPESRGGGVNLDTVNTAATMHDVRRLPVFLLVVDIVDSSTFYRSLSSEELPQVIGRWFSACRELMDAEGGFINQYLGDGFFGHWADGSGVPEKVAAALGHLRVLQEGGAPHFRWVLHHGNVLAAGAVHPGEESMMGPDMHFVFRMEGVAKALGVTALLSEGAAGRLTGLLTLREAGQSDLKGFEGDFKFFTVAGGGP